MRERFPPMTEQQMSEAQRRVAADIASGPRGGLRGPFLTFLRSPELADTVQKVGEYLRFKGVLPRHVMELAVLLTARRHASVYEWQAHAPLSVKAGLPQAVVDAVAARRRPAAMSPEVEEAWEFVHALLERGAVPDAAFEKVKARWGEQGAVELAATSGYYSMLAMVMNVAQTPMPEGKTAPFPPNYAPNDG